MQSIATIIEIELFPERFVNIFSIVRITKDGEFTYINKTSKYHKMHVVLCRRSTWLDLYQQYVFIGINDYSSLISL